MDFSLNVRHTLDQEQLQLWAVIPSLPAVVRMALKNLGFPQQLASLPELTVARFAHGALNITARTCSANMFIWRL